MNTDLLAAQLGHMLTGYGQMGIGYLAANRHISPQVAQIIMYYRLGRVSRQVCCDIFSIHVAVPNGQLGQFAE